MSGTATVFVTPGFERHLDRIERFLADAGVPEHFDTLLDALQNVVIPNLEPTRTWVAIFSPAGRSRSKPHRDSSTSYTDSASSITPAASVNTS